MRFLHISDLHIGKRVNEFSMIEDQKYILKQIASMIDEEKIDGVLIAGDIYDKAVPSAEAVTVFDAFLTELAKKDVFVFMISGNHDSPERIAFGSELMKGCKVFVAPVFDGEISPVVLQDEYGEICLYLLPFVKPAQVRAVFPGEEIDSYHTAVKKVMDTLPVDTGKRNILLAHQFVTGAVRCESEELSIGGLDNVDAALFDAFDYVALGHIHGPQSVGRETVRYCGTPLKYSFSEAHHKKSVTIVDLKEKGDVGISAILLKSRRDMRELKGFYQELTSRESYAGTEVEDYLHITLLDEEDIPDVIGKLRSIYPNVMRVDYDNKRTRAGQVQPPSECVRQKSPLELFEELYEKQNNREMTEEQRSFTMELIEKIWEGQ